mgnify:CR=1 FL=1
MIPGLAWGQSSVIEHASAWQDSTWANLFPDEGRALGFVERVFAVDGLPDTVLGNLVNVLHFQGNWNVAQLVLEEIHRLDQS